jgi:carotenoid cleavage dioxygenase-like enzyme
MELNGRLTKLGSEHPVFVVPPVHYDLPSLLSDQVAAADALRYVATEPTRLIVLRKAVPARLSSWRGQPV